MNHDPHKFIHKFRQEWTGKIPDHNGDLGYDYDECVDGPNLMCRELGVCESYGNARDLDYSKCGILIPNTPEFVPKPCDIAIMLGGPYDPVYGHTGIVLGGCDVSKFRLFSCNFPDGSPFNTYVGDYTGVQKFYRLNIFREHHA